MEKKKKRIADIIDKTRRHISDMFFIKSGYEKELDRIITDIDMNMNNNYKDNAQSDLQRFENRLDEMLAQGFLKEKQKRYYKQKLNQYKEELKGYTHKDQLKNWG